MKIAVHFDAQPVLDICVDNTETGRMYFDLCREQNTVQEPFYRDTLMYTPDYMIELAEQAQQAFGWDWFSDHYDLSVTTQLHKDLEHSVGQLGFANIPAEYDTLLYELHHCLHAVQSGKTAPGRWDNLQVEWLTDNAAPLPATFEFKESHNQGDLILINPYVGHNPVQIYREQDFGSLSTTCRFHNIIKPSIVLTARAYHVAKDTVLQQFVQLDPEFVDLHGAEKIKYYTGSAVIGHVQDPAVLQHITQFTGVLTLDHVEFHE